MRLPREKYMFEGSVKGVDCPLKIGRDVLLRVWIVK